MLKFLVISILAISLTFSTSIDKLSFYKAFESNSEVTMQSKIESLEKLTQSDQKDAYLGAITMKKSQFEKTPKEKAELFKIGKTLLESAIDSSPKKVEYRFLRLAIQENTPKVLKYNTSIEEDVNMIQNSYSSLDGTVKRVIKKYAESSKNLNSQSLK